MESKRVRAALFAASMGVVWSSIAIGCGVEPAETPETVEPSPEAGPSRRPPSTPPPEEDAAPPPTCIAPGEIEVEASFGGAWKGPGAAESACTQGDVDAVKALFAAAEQVAFTDLEKAVAADCRSCLFTPSGGTSWGPFVRFQDGFFPNYGACWALGTSEECARQITYAERCFDLACEEVRCGTGNARDACIQRARTTVCKPFADAVDASCGAQLGGVLDTCSDIYQLITTTCGAPADGGPGLDAAPF